MERALKERTLGAVVLVVFAVLIVPVFLDGPGGEGETVTETVTLPGQNGQARQQQTIILERDREQPVPAAVSTSEPSGEKVVESTAGETPLPVPAPAEAENESPQPAPLARSKSPPEKRPAQKQVEAPAAEATPAAIEQSETGMWAVQLGSFSRRQNAERLAADLRGEGYAAFLSKLDTSSGELHRVRVGPQANRDAAEGVATTLAGAGHKGQVVPHP